jgi:hypothetical protein
MICVLRQEEAIQSMQSMGLLGLREFQLKLFGA